MATTRRADIQGLRALAVLAVVAFHVRPAWFPGGFAGVDVFFVISGYLITSALLRGARTGRVGLAAFWGRRIRRLMPAATVVIVATLLASAVVMPMALRPELTRQAVASALSMENWLLAANSVSYLHATALPSPFQHFWSLSVEEQFYVVWPLVVAGAALAAVRLRRSPTAVIGGAAVVLAGASLAWSVAVSQSQGDVAYFSTATRAWELLVGGLLAVWLPRRQLRPAVARPAFAVGLVLVVASIAALDNTMAFPGWVALLPTTGAALLIGAGATAFTSLPRRLMEWRPVTYVGDISYSLYLWHWPIVVLVCAALGTATVPRLAVVPVVAASVLLAALSKRYVEDRFLRVGPRHAARAGAVAAVRRSSYALGGSLLAATALTVAVVVALPEPAPATPAAGAVTASGSAYAGARVLDPQFHAATPPDPSLPPAPTLLELQTTEPQLRDPCLTHATNDAVTTCTGGVADGTRTVLLAGDSHTTMWLPAFEELGQRYGWHIVVAGKQSCPLATLDEHEDPDGPIYGGCRAWNTQIRDVIRDLHPDLVVTSARFYPYPHGDAEGPVSYDRESGLQYATQYRFIEGLGIPVAAVTEVPYFPGFSAPDCLSRAGATVADCTEQMNAARATPPSRIDFAAKADPKVTLIDVTEQICPDRCDAVIGNVVTYRDDNHLTPLFAGSLAWVFERDLRASHPDLFAAA
ncbi:acyltransferase family protein [Cellulomonas sp. P5_C6]